MRFKNKLFNALAVSAAAFMLYCPAFAETPSKKPDKAKGSEDYSLSRKFNEEMDKRFEVEARKENVWNDVQRVYISEQDPDNLNRRNPYLDYSDPVKDKIEKSAQRAALDALELTLKETKIWDLVVERFKWLTKMEIVKNKDEKLKIKDPISEIKKSERDVEEKIEDKIDRLEKDIETHKKANNLKEAERLENERDKMKDQLYSKRKFKTSFGFSLNYGNFNMNDFDVEAHSKFESKHLNGKLSYHTKQNKICLELDKEYVKDSHVKLENTYEKSQMPGEDYEANSSLSLIHRVSKDLSVSLSQSHNWTYDKEVTSAGVSKSLGNDTSVFVSGYHDWAANSSGVLFGLNINF